MIVQQNRVREKFPRKGGTCGCCSQGSFTDLKTASEFGQVIVASHRGILLDVEIFP